MSETNELAETGANDLDVFGGERERAPVERQRWLDRINMLYGTSKAVTNGLANVGEFMVKDDVLPKENIVLVVAARAHAVLIIDGKLASESYSPKESHFAEIIKREAANFQCKVKGVDPRVGDDYLLYSFTLGKFVTNHVCKTARRAQDTWEKALASGKPVILTHRVEKNSANEWPIPCIKPIEGEVEVVMFSKEDAVHAAGLFNNPKPKGPDREEKGKESDQPAAKAGGRKAKK